MESCGKLFPRYTATVPEICNVRNILVTTGVAATETDAFKRKDRVCCNTLIIVKKNDFH